MYSLNNVFKPLDSTTGSLDEAVKTYGARFEINRFEKAPVQLAMEMQSSAGEKELFEKTHVVWSRLDQKDSYVPVDISMLRLDG